jgi:hypothetical protein
MYERNYHEDAEVIEDSVVTLSDENIYFYNRLQITHSYQQICCLEDDFDCAREACERDPEVRSPERRRWGST